MEEKKGRIRNKAYDALKAGDACESEEDKRRDENKGKPIE